MSVAIAELARVVGFIDARHVPTHKFMKEPERVAGTSVTAGLPADHSRQSSCAAFKGTDVRVGPETSGPSIRTVAGPSLADTLKANLVDAGKALRATVCHFDHEPEACDCEYDPWRDAGHSIGGQDDPDGRDYERED